MIINKLGKTIISIGGTGVPFLLYDSFVRLPRPYNNLNVSPHFRKYGLSLKNTIQLNDNISYHLKRLRIDNGFH